MPMKRPKLAIALFMLALCANLSFAEVCDKKFLQDTEQFNRDYKMKCESGAMRACFTLGGEFHKLDKIKEARRFYKKACDKNLDIACLYLAISNGDSQEQQKIYDKLDTACKKGDSQACEDREMSDVPAGNIELCQKGDAEVCTLLGKLEYENGSYAVAEHDLSKACDKKAKDACNLLNQMKAEGLFCK